MRNKTVRILGRVGIPILSLFLLISAGAYIQKPHFKRLTIEAKHGCSAGFNKVETSYNTLKGVYTLSHSDCGHEPFQPFDTFAFPDEVLKLINRAKRHSRRVTRLTVYNNQIGKYSCYGYIKDSLNFRFVVEKK